MGYDNGGERGEMGEREREREEERREKKNAWSLIQNNSHLTSTIQLSVLVFQIFFSIMLLY